MKKRGKIKEMHYSELLPLPMPHARANEKKMKKLNRSIECLGNLMFWVGRTNQWLQKTFNKK